MLDILVNDLCSEIIAYLDIISMYNISRVSQRYYHLTKDRLKYHREDLDLYIDEAIYYLDNCNFYLEIEGNYRDIFETIFSVIPCYENRQQIIFDLVGAKCNKPLPSMLESISTDQRYRAVICSNKRTLYKASTELRRFSEYNILAATLAITKFSRSPMTTSIYGIIQEWQSEHIIRKLLHLCYLKGYRLISHYKRPLTFKHIAIS